MLTLLTALALGPPAADTLRVFRLDTLAPGVYAATVLPRPDAYAFANSLVVVGDDGALVVDTQQSPTAAGVLVGWVRDLADVPVAWVVNTHWHGDHVYGNQAWADTYPDVRFAAHPATREGMTTEGARHRAEELSTLPASIEERRRWLREGRGPDGAPLTEAQREQVVYSVRLREAYLRDLRTLRPVLPNVDVREPLVLDLGAREVHLLPLGPAHTAGDVAVWVPDAGVLAVGDLLEEAAPWIDGADLPGWARALAKLQEVEGVRALLPAHGSVQRDSGLLDGTAALLRAIVEGADEARGLGWSAEEGAARLDFETHRPFLAGLGVEGDAFDAFFTAALAEVLAGG
jgi:glyoxylase-like metal-dependent hydrolase (beta-lactamase superfamily II)